MLNANAGSGATVIVTESVSVFEAVPFVMAEADAVFVTEPALILACVIWYVPVQVVDAPGTSGLTAPEQFMLIPMLLSSVTVNGETRLPAVLVFVRV